MTRRAVKLLFGGEYDRVVTVPRAGREVGIEITTEFLPGPKAAFEALSTETDVDGGEMSISFYMTQRSRLKERSDLVALPVWVSRSFRHGNLFVLEDSDLTDPADLAGRSVGLAEYGMTMAVWLRGIFADEVGLKASDVRWFTGRDPASLGEELLRLPAGVEISPADRTVPLLEQIRNGTLDAMIGAGQVPLPDGVRRMLPDHVATERDYFARTGVFPIMHVLVLRREFVESRPDDVPLVLAAFERAKQIALERLWSTSVSYVTLPWTLAAVEEQTALAGRDPWPYGVGPNLPTLTTLARYMGEQGLLWDDLPIDDYFAHH